MFQINEKSNKSICVIGDVHGHLQLGLCVAARWQQELGVTFDAVFLCGDVGTFTSEEQLDSTTRRHGKANPCELEFLSQWSTDPQPPWLSQIFEPIEKNGLGLCCPIVMVHGNHEGFVHLQGLKCPQFSAESVPLEALPAIDTGSHIRYLPSGLCCRTPSGLRVAGIGGIEPDQRYANYHKMAYIDDDAVCRLLEGPNVDILVTHQGPSELQGKKGSKTLQLLLDAGTASFWFHGHSIVNPAITWCGPRGATLVVPMADIAFPIKGSQRDDPGDEGWAVLYPDNGEVKRERPAFWRDYRRRKWKEVSGSLLVCPDLIR